MKPEHEVWWLALADQYEAWAEKPPRLRCGTMEIPTCFALATAPQWGFVHGTTPSGALSKLWGWGFANKIWPAGFVSERERPERRREFCLWMAETIRDYIEDGIAPWEDV